MRILILTQWCEPEPVLKGVAFAKALAALGHDVEILTGFPNYPTGKVYDGYRITPHVTETVDGIVVHRVALYPSHNTSAVCRILNYVSFAISAALVGTFKLRKPDVVFAYQPAATIGLPALCMYWLRNVPFVYDINDLWPDSLRATGMLTNGFVLRLIDRWCQFVYKRAALITVLSPGFKAALLERGVPAHKIRVIYLWCDDTQITAAIHSVEVRREAGFEGCFNILFAGTMGKAQGLDAVLSAAALLRDRFPKVKFTFVGDGIESDHLQRRAIAENLTNVQFLPRRPSSQIGQLLSAADVLLVHLKDDPLFKITIPSKTQAYLAAGRPILMAVRGDASDLVREAQAGVPCAPEDARELAAAAEYLARLPSEELDRMARNAREFYLKFLSLRRAAHELDSVFGSIGRSPGCERDKQSAIHDQSGERCQTR